MGDVFVRVHGLAALQFGVQRQDLEPSRWWIAAFPKLYAGVAEQPPAAMLRSNIDDSAPWGDLTGLLR